MSDRSISDAIRILAGKTLADELYWMAASVDSVDEDARTCAVTALTGHSQIQIPDVRLQAEVSDGLLIIPSVGSTVFIAYTKANEPYICLFSDVDHVLLVVGSSAIEITNDGKIKFNDGSLGGLTKTQELQTQLNKTNQLLQALLTVINGAPIPEPGSGAPSALQTALQSALTGQQLGDYSQIENTNITHG